MKRFIIFLLHLFFFNFIIAQTSTSFFLVPYNKYDLTPTKKTWDGNQLHLKFPDNNLTELFNNMTILSYELAFEDLNCDDYLNKVYKIQVLNPINIQKFSNSPLIEHVEIIIKPTLAKDLIEINANNTKEINNENFLTAFNYVCPDVYDIPSSAILPNDFYIPTSNDHPDYTCDSIPNDYLTLIQAPCAWKITHGNPNILVGIADSFFSEAHEELTGKFDTIWGSTAYAGNYSHGIGVAGLIAGNTNNAKGTSSIGYNTRLVGAYGGDLFERVKQLALWSAAHNNKIRVINMSWGSFGSPQNHPPSSILARLYRCIRDKYNIVLVAAAGNSFHNGTNHIVYFWPASYNSVISVTTIGSRFPRESTINDSLWQDVAEWWPNHSWPLTANDSVDISAPGYRIYRPSNEGGVEATENTYRLYGRGTSQAAPIVSGVAALVISVNPSLTAQQVMKIIKVTADVIDTIPENVEYTGLLGSGRVNAYKAVKMAQYFDEYGYNWNLIPKDVDYYIKDSSEDLGKEPNNITEYFWESKDIWVRNQPDGIEENQNPEYNPNNPSYIYIRVRNRGCDPSSGNDRVKLYWAKAATDLAWPYSWEGNPYNPDNPNGPVIGDSIGSVQIPSILPGAEIIVKIPWQVPDPTLYENINDQPWHFCLLAQIHSEDDPTTPLPPGNNSLVDYVKNNNNVAWKNITVVDLNPNTIGQPIGGTIAVGNPYSQPKTFNIQFSAANPTAAKKIFSQAEVSITIDDALFHAWEQGGKNSINLRRLKGNVFIVTGDNATFKNLKFESKKRGTAHIKFNFLTKKITAQDHFIYRAIQKMTATEKIIGGETYKINKSPRPPFYAVVNGTMSVDKGEEISLNAESINEPAIYNWYDSEGNLIFQGADFSTSVTIGRKYKLEVIALSDGYKDYKNLKISYKPNRINTISPNPTNNQLIVNYQINQGSNAYLTINPVTGGSTIGNNYILDTQSHTATLNLSLLPQGVYLVSIVVDGQINDSKTIIKN